ncbi:hypothetical protein Poli38472_009259 [Pythium oligandrum]|uniref:PH domain-containing protein n=1 Tax=Pythium oligandrum TaxID=41045 RepID=A0A8K1CKE7_PYTOL|nr:hypothetical protein Poli38472_009259 [Pythium oligandrum]|eukprot:TMW65092.1 hypothetical protein Poli38472_009259 [Pythium oligandrum]
MSRSSSVTGFLQITDLNPSPSSPRFKGCFSLGWRRRRSDISTFRDRWLYCVLRGVTLSCYRCRADVRMSHEPVQVMTIDVREELTIERGSLIVRCRLSGRRFRLQTSPNENFLQWVTALYLEKLTYSSPTNQATESPKKRVQFGIEPKVTEIESSVESDADLYYSRAELDQFRRLCYADNAQAFRVRA